jgi:hypothetical protein
VAAFATAVFVGGGAEDGYQDPVYGGGGEGKPDLGLDGLE